VQTPLVKLKMMPKKRWKTMSADTVGTSETRLTRFVEQACLGADPRILDVARSIPERDLSLREDSRRRLTAYVGDTTVDMDLEQQTIIHALSNLGQISQGEGVLPACCQGLLDEVIQKALEIAPEQTIKINVGNGKPESVSISLRARIEKMKLADRVHVETRAKEIYLLKGPAKPYAGKPRGRRKQT
jgi:hypothetical protein